MNQLEKYGVTQRYINEATLFPEYELARIVSQYKDLYKIISNQGESLAEVSGKFRHDATQISDFPAVGDFVMITLPKQQGSSIIHAVLTRKSSFERISAGTHKEVQIVASNIDYVFLCMALNYDYNLSRLERYLSIAWDSGAIPVIVLTKADLCENLPHVESEISSISLGADVVITSSMMTDSWKKLLPYLTSGKTASFIGSSGVGKSTLINHLLEKQVLATAELRQNEKGKHTSTRRELMVLPQGGLVIDTPGMREIGVDTADLSKSFSDIGELASACKFRDCTHQTEPGCAIQKALKDGTLDPRRFSSYEKLKKEARYDGLTSKQIETEKMTSMFASVGGIKQAKKMIKEKRNWK